MKKPFLISTLSLAMIFSGLGSISPVSAKYIAPSDVVFEVSELINFIPQFESELAAHCEVVDNGCISDFVYTHRGAEDGIYKALWHMLSKQVIVSSINPTESTIKLATFDKDTSVVSLLTYMQGNSVTSLRVGWSNETWLIGTSSGIPKDESSAPSDFYYIYNSDEGNEDWIPPYTEVEISLFGPDSSYSGPSLQNNTSNSIQFEFETEHSDIPHFNRAGYGSCLYSQYYGEGVECRALFSGSTDEIFYLPFKDGVPAYPRYAYPTIVSQVEGSTTTTTTDTTTDLDPTPDPDLDVDAGSDPNLDSDLDTDAGSDLNPDPDSSSDPNPDDSSDQATETQVVQNNVSITINQTINQTVTNNWFITNNIFPAPSLDAGEVDDTTDAGDADTDTDTDVDADAVTGSDLTTNDLGVTNPLGTPDLTTSAVQAPATQASAVTSQTTGDDVKAPETGRSSASGEANCLLASTFFLPFALLLSRTLKKFKKI